MKLITELSEKVEYLTETHNGKKATYITGPFMMWGKPNKNGRVYTESVMNNAVDKYKNGVIAENRAYGELNHPKGPTLDLERVCILIKELNVQKDGNVIGKARVVETPMGKIVKGLMESGANLGVSSRGLGSIKENSQGIMEVQNDFHLVTASDVVADPSAPSAFVKGIMENVEWIYNENTGEFAEMAKKQLNKYSKSQIEEAKIQWFKAFLRKL